MHTRWRGSRCPYDHGHRRAAQKYETHTKPSALLDESNTGCLTRHILAGAARPPVDPSNGAKHPGHVCAGTDRFVFGMVEEQDGQLPNKEKDRQERAAARQKLLEEKAAARQQRVEVTFTIFSCVHLSREKASPPGLCLAMSSLVWEEGAAAGQQRRE